MEYAGRTFAYRSKLFRNATADMPATCASQVMPAPAASRSRTVARLIDGPIPSPGIRVTVVDIASGVELKVREKIAPLAAHDEVRDGPRQRGRQHARIGARRVALHLTDKASLRE